MVQMHFVYMSFFFLINVFICITVVPKLDQDRYCVDKYRIHFLYKKNNYFQDKKLEVGIINTAGGKDKGKTDKIMQLHG